VEENGNVGHHTAFVWMGRVAEIFNFEELRDVEAFSSDLESEASVAMSVALGYVSKRDGIKEKNYFVKFLIIQEIRSTTVDKCTPNRQIVSWRHKGEPEEDRISAHEQGEPIRPTM